MTKTKCPNLSSDWLHLGCGLTAPASWLNVDGSLQVLVAARPTLKKALVALRIYPRTLADVPWPSNIMRLDLRKPLPFANDRFEAIYSSHALEHLRYNDAERLLKECYRILKPGGVCRIVVPDLESIARRYVHSVERQDDGAADQFMESFNVHLRMDESGILGFYRGVAGVHRHKWMYDALSLSRLLRSCGFDSITNAQCREGRMPGLEEVEDPGRILGGEGIAVEAIKP